MLDHPNSVSYKHFFINNYINIFWLMQNYESTISMKCYFKNKILMVGAMKEICAYLQLFYWHNDFCRKRSIQGASHPFPTLLSGHLLIYVRKNLCKDFFYYLILYHFLSRGVIVFNKWGFWEQLYLHLKNSSIFLFYA